MAKIPYLVRRKNVFYFRLVVPVELRDTVKVREITQSLRTENRVDAAHKALEPAAHFKAALHGLKSGNVCEINKPVMVEPKNNISSPSGRVSQGVISVNFAGFKSKTALSITRWETKDDVVNLIVFSLLVRDCFLEVTLARRYVYTIR